MLTTDEDAALRALAEAVSETAWEHGGIEFDRTPIFGAVADHVLAVACSYEALGEIEITQTIASAAAAPNCAANIARPTPTSAFLRVVRGSWGRFLTASGACESRAERWDAQQERRGDACRCAEERAVCGDERDRL